LTPTYAVPGEDLAAGAATYQRLSSGGAHFLNHGGRSHTMFDRRTGRFVSSYFYDTLSVDEIKADIVLGHRTVREVLGTSPTGFRTPHFGTFSGRQQLKLLHEILCELDYQFSSSSLPWLGLRNGPVFRSPTGIVEFPVSGRSGRPSTVLDTWSVWGSPFPSLSGDAFMAELEHYCQLGETMPLLLNIYGDPSHVVHRDEFFIALKRVVSVFHPTTFSALLASK